MRSVYIVLLMGAAALCGGILVRYKERPVQFATLRSVPPSVVAPPVPPSVRVGPSSSVPVHSPFAPASQDEAMVAVARVEKPPAKPSAFNVIRSQEPAPVVTSADLTKAKLTKANLTKANLTKANLDSAPAHPQARTRIPADPPTVIALERSTIVPSAPPPQPVIVHQVAAVSPAVAVSSSEAFRGAPAPAPLQAPPPTPNHATLRAGMLITVRVNEALSSNLNSPGDVFSGTLDRPLVADGFVIAERGAHVRGEVVESKSPERGQGVPELSIRLREIVASDGQRVHLVSQPWRKQGGGASGYDAAGGPGAAFDLALTRNGAAFIRRATTISFRLDQPVELTEKR